MSARVTSIPDTPFVPDQSPEATQEVASVEVQFNVEVLPAVVDVGLAFSDAVGAGSTVTVTDALALPPAPVQLSEKALVAARAPVARLPEVAFAPDHAPEAVHEVALVEDQVSIDEPPLATEAGLAVNETVGVGRTVTIADALALPPAPVQVSENVVLAPSAPVDWLPDVPKLPDHPPEAIHEAASVDD